MGLIAMLIVGGIAGWLAATFMNKTQGILMNIVIGVVGAFVAGLVLNLLGIDVHSGGYWFTFFVALGGAVVLLGLLGLVRKT